MATEWKYRRFYFERDRRYGSGLAKTPVFEAVAGFLEELGSRASQAKVVHGDEELIVYYPVEE